MVQRKAEGGRSVANVLIINILSSSGFYVGINEKFQASSQRRILPVPEPIKAFFQISQNRIFDWQIFSSMKFINQLLIEFRREIIF